LWSLISEPEVSEDGFAAGPLLLAGLPELRRSKLQSRRAVDADLVLCLDNASA
jgi:hypothetical protein